MAHPPTSPGWLRRTLGLSVADAIFHAVMLGLSESYLGALAVELGHGDASLALLVTVPLLAGAAAQLAAGLAVAALGTRKRAVVAGATLQAASVLAFVWIAGTGERALAPLLGAKCLWWIAGSIIAPPWGAWMADLTERVDRQRYFARRSGAGQLALVAAITFGGFVLGTGSGGPEILVRYEALFLAAALARLVSAFALASKRDPVRRQAAATPGIRTRMGMAIRESSWQLPLYIVGLMFGAHVAIPFFTPYMLRTLDLEYGSFGLLNAASVASKAAMFPLCHRLSGAFGVPRVLLAGGTGVAMVPLLWAAAEGVPGIALVEIVGGVSWAAFEYGSFQILLGSSPATCRVEFLAIQGTLVGVAQLAGSLVGSALLEGSWALSYREVFVVSCVLRFAPLVLLFWVARRLHVRPLNLLLRLVGVRPGGGGIARPIVRDEVPPE